MRTSINALSGIARSYHHFKGGCRDLSLSKKFLVDICGAVLYLLAYGFAFARVTLA